MSFLRGFVILFALGFAGSALADIEIYAGATAGSSDAGASAGSIQSELTAKGWNITGVSVDSKDSGWRFVTGLQFTDIFAVELGYVDLGEISTQVDGSIPPPQAAQFGQDVANALPVMPKGITLAGVARFDVPSVEKLSVALKLGVIDADSERKVNGARGSDEVDASPYYGVVAGWEFSDSWRGVLGFEVFNMSDTTEYWSAGVEFTFPAY